MLIQKVVQTSPHFFRPPYGYLRPGESRYLLSQGELPTLWSVDTRDWSQPGPARIIQQVVGNLRPGDIILMHDGGGDRSQTIVALQELLPFLRQKHYRLLTLSEMMALPDPDGLPVSRRLPGT